MILASGANESSRPVTRSSKRVPTAMSRSDFCSAPTAETAPCMPGMPMFSGCASGRAPRAIRVVTTGIPVSSTRSASSCQARALMMPPPMYSTGRFDRQMIRADSLIWRPWGWEVGL